MCRLHGRSHRSVSRAVIATGGWEEAGNLVSRVESAVFLLKPRLLWLRGYLGLLYEIRRYWDDGRFWSQCGTFL